MHYHFDTTDETLKAWTLGLGSHPLPWEVIRKSVKEDSVSFRSLAKRKIIRECWKTGRPFYYIDTGYVGNLIKKKIYFRVVKNNVQHSQVFKCPDDRWKKIARISPELDFVEWRKNNKGKILLVTPREKPCKFYGIDRNKWVEKTIKKLNGMFAIAAFSFSNKTDANLLILTQSLISNPLSEDRSAIICNFFDPIVLTLIKLYPKPLIGSVKIFQTVSSISITFSSNKTYKQKKVSNCPPSN